MKGFLMKGLVSALVLVVAVALIVVFLINPPRWQPKLYAVEWPASLSAEAATILQQQFPEDNGLVRHLRGEELSAPNSSAWGVLAYVEPREFASLKNSGAHWRVVPDTWEEREPPPWPSLRVYDPPAPLGGEPACAVAPRPNTFCPYGTTSSQFIRATYPGSGWTCNRSLEQQMLAGADTHPPVAGRLYYETIRLGSTREGNAIRGVRLGRHHDPGDPEATPQLVLLAGQHPNEWGPIEYARQVLFRLADEYRDGDPEVRAALESASLLVVPVGSPDGYDSSHNVMGQRRRRTTPGSCSEGGSIDLNRNSRFAWGLNEDGSSSECGDSMYRGREPESATEQQVLRSLSSMAGYHTLLVDNLHAKGGIIMSTEGYSPGDLNEAITPCGDDDNCTAPDLGLVYRLAGTEARPILHNSQDTSVPYIIGSGFRELYQTNGDLISDLTYNSPTARGAAVTLTIEEDEPCSPNPEQIRTNLLDREVEQYRALVLHQLGLLPSLATRTTPDFEMPLIGRRNAAGSLAAEPPTFRVAVRNNLTEVSVRTDGEVPGDWEPDDVRAGALYSLVRWRPADGGYVMPRRYRVCANDANCREAIIPAPDDSRQVDLCSPNNFFWRGSAWSWVGDQPGSDERECYHTLTTPGVIGPDATLTSAYYDFSNLKDGQLILDLDFSSFGTPSVSFDLEVSSNDFRDCSFNNYGNCRIARRMDWNWDGYRYKPSGKYRTLVADVSDFDGQGAVRFRVRVFGNSDAPSDQPRLRIYSATPIGWYVSRSA